ncbi:MAG: PD-(D/E)XK nuclease family protein [Chloroflexota bacterium]
MNELQKTLAEIMGREKTRAKVLLVPSFSVGHQITESLVRSGVPYLNLRISTPLSLAHEVVALDLARESITYLPAGSLPLVIEDLLEDLQGRSDFYFHGLADKEGVVRALARSVRDLRMSGIAAAELSPSQFVSDRKGSDIRELLGRYELLLQERKFADAASILSRSIDKLGTDGRDRDIHLYLMLSHIPLTPLEKRLAGVLPGDTIVLPHDVPQGLDRPARYLDQPIGRKSANATTNVERLPWLFKVDDAPPAVDDDTIRIFHAVGRRNEVKEVFRRIVTSGVRGDEVEMICTSYEDYIPLIYDFSRKCETAMTFAEGLPVSVTKPGRAALGFIAWLRSGYEAVQLKHLIKSGCLDLRSQRTDDASSSPAMMARILRESPIGRGMERYETILREMIELYSSRLKKAVEEGDPTDYHRKRIDNATFLLEFVGNIIGTIPAPDAAGTVELAGLCTCASSFVSTYARTADELDGEAKSAVLAALDEIRRLSRKRLPMKEALERIDGVLREMRVGASMPAPGCIHVSSYHHGGFSGRDHTYVLGCEGQAIPGIPVQDPVILDEERTRVGGDMTVSSDRLKENLYCFATVLASLRGTVTMSFPSYDVLENRDCAPSSVLLQVHRLTSGKPDADYSDLMNALGGPVGYMPGDHSIDVTDFWIGRFTGPGGLKKADESVFACYPGLSSGRAAAGARESDAVTEFDGKVPLDKTRDPRENPDLVMSASMIETVAKCPFSYLLKHVLRVKPLDELVIQPDRWLPPQDRGALLHELFRRFMTTLAERGEKPSVKNHLTLIQGMADTLAREYRDLIPPPGEAIYEQERKDILKAAEVFLKVEEEYCKGCIPEFFELPFGVDDEEARKLGTTSPVVIPLSQGKSFTLRGRIDRIDRTSDDGYEVWDYKTGDPRKFKDHGRFDKGTNLQHALYALAAESILRKMRKDKRIAVEKSGYFFPTERGAGRRVTREPDDKSLREVLDALFDILRSGAFVPAGDKENCRFCDYANVCGETVVEDAKRKAKNQGNEVLEPFLRLKEYE